MLSNFDRWLVRSNRAAVGLMMGIMFVLVFLNVVLRYCFGRSIATAEEVSTFLMIWATYLGAGLALREGRHAAIDLLQDLLPQHLRRALRTLLGLVVLLFFGVLAYYGALFARFGWDQETIATQIPQGIPYLCIPIGALLVVIHLLLRFRRWVERDWESPALPDETDFEGGDRI
jgi:TRAP-type C4-dicarboxylate transport system permease small subunit